MNVYNQNGTNGTKVNSWSYLTLTLESQSGYYLLVSYLVILLDS